MRKGTHANSVRQLPQALKQLDFDCGTSDWDFASRTQQVMKNFQSTGQSQKVNWVYGQETGLYAGGGQRVIL